MRKVLLSLGSLLPLALAAQGLHFESGTWAETLAKAKAERRPIFLDAQTVWCGPCKLMAAKTFPDSAVSAFFNANFLNVKMDMERGEGVSVADQYKIWLYPTLLFVDGDGAVRHRAAGFHDAKQFLALGQIALDPTRNLAALEKKYAQGDRHSTFLLEYLEAKAAAVDPDAGKVANEYLRTQDSLGSPANATLIMRHVDDPYSEGFGFLMKNRATFEQTFGVPAVKSKIENVFENYLQSHPRLQLGEVQRLYGTAYPEQGEQLASAYRLTYYRQRGDADNFVRAALDHYTRYPSEDADELNEMAGLVSESTTDPTALRTALQWAQRAVNRQETYYTQYTLAALFAKNGQKKAAQKAAQRARALAQAEGQDTALMDDLLAKLKQK
jgi:thiol-disulfide isomerase/thioredoxin